VEARSGDVASCEGVINPAVGTAFVKAEFPPIAVEVFEQKGPRLCSVTNHISLSPFHGELRCADTPQASRFRL